MVRVLAANISSCKKKWHEGSYLDKNMTKAPREAAHTN